MRSTIVALVTAGLLGSGVLAATAAQAATPAPAPAPAPATSAAGYQPPAPVFGPCADPTLVSRGAQCANVTVPLDYKAPNGKKIKIAISRVKHTVPDAQYQGIMLVNPGGPGGSGLIYSVLGGSSTLAPGVGGSYDWIGFDPRGVGSSSPALSCDPGYAGYNRPYYIPDTLRNEAAWVKKAGIYTAQCAIKGRDLLGHLTTVDSVNDMDSIRKALAAPQLNFYGFSYGTYLGSVYSTLYPDKVRRMVLDGVVDPTRIWEPANYDQDSAFEKTIKIYFTWVAKYDSIYHLGATEAAVEKLYYDQYQKLRTAPAGGKIGSSEWNDLFLQAGYYVYGWEDIATAFSAWVNHGDPAGLLELYPPATDDNGYAIYLGVQCTDAKWSNYLKFRKDNAALYPSAPFETWSNAWFNAPCTVWPAKAGTPVKVNGSTAPPTLLVSETFDAATPFSGALKVRSLFPKSALVEGVNGSTHAGTFGLSACENTAVSNFLGTGTLPARAPGNVSDLRCAPNPQPVPAAPSAVQAMAKTAAAAAQAVQPLAPQRWSGLVAGALGVS